MELASAKRIFLTAKRSEGLSVLSIAAYQEDLDCFFKFLVSQQIFSVSEIRPFHVREHLIELKNKGLRGISVHRHFRAIRAWANFLVSEEVLEKTFLTNVGAPKIEQKQSRTFNAEELSRLLNYFSGAEFLQVRNRVIILTLFASGLRSSELRKLTLDDINITANLLIVRDAKGLKSRHVPIANALRMELKRYLKARAEKLGAMADATPWLFVTEVGRPLGKSAVIHIFARVKEDLQLKGERVSAHTLRHSFARHFIASGGDVFTLQRLMGHSDLAITKKYVSLDDSDLRRSFEKFNPLDNAKWML